MNEWILIMPMAAFALLAVAFLLGILHQRHIIEVQRLQLGAAHIERTDLYAQNADLREACQECIAERDSLKLQLSSVHATRPVQPSIPVKRVSRKKDEGNGNE